MNRNSPTLAVRQAAMPFMEDIQDVLNQNVNLAVLDGWVALLVERLSRRGSVANRAQISGRLAVHISSAGLALMSYQLPSMDAEYLGQFKDPAGKVTRDNPPRALAAANHLGYAQLAGVIDPDTWGIAVPVLDGKKRTVVNPIPASSGNTTGTLTKGLQSFLSGLKIMSRLIHLKPIVVQPHTDQRLWWP